MAITQLGFDTHRNNTTATATVSTLTPGVGDFMLALSGHYWKESGETLTITTPASSYTQQVTTTDVAVEVMCRAHTDTWAASDGNSVVATASLAANRGTCLALWQLSGVSGFDAGSSLVQSLSTSVAIPATVGAAANGSKAYLLVVRQSAAEALGTPTYTKTGTAAGAWTEKTKVQFNGIGIEMYVAEAPVEVGETIGCTWSTTASAQDLGGVIVVLTPSTNVEPSLAVKDFMAAEQVARSGIGITYTDDDNLAGTHSVTVVVDEGTVTMTDLTGVTVV